MHLKIAKLKKLKRWILDEPRRYNQNVWFTQRGDLVADQKPPCGTVACLGGSACLMEGLTVSGMFDTMVEVNGNPTPIREVAGEILGLSSSQADQLFESDGDGWPNKARAAYHSATTPEQYAKAAAMAIDALIEQGRPRKATKRR